MNITLVKAQKSLIQSSENSVRIMQQILLRVNRFRQQHEYVSITRQNEEFENTLCGTDCFRYTV